MAHRRFTGRRAQRPSATRALNWQSQVEQGFVNTAAATVRTVSLMSSSLGIGTDEVSFTCYRIVGTIQVQAQADALASFHVGVYKSQLGAGSVSTLLNPFIDAELEQWMWWTAFNTRQNADIRKMDVGFINVDIKVKRIIRGGEDINLGIISNVAY